MRFVGFYNFGGSGTETITGGANPAIPSARENVCAGEMMFFSGQFSNLSRYLVDITLRGFQRGGVSQMHRHDLRAYESLNCIMIPLSEVAISPPANIEIGFHGMGLLWEAEDKEEYAICAAKSKLTESLNQSPDFVLDRFEDNTVAAIGTSTLWTPVANTTIGLYKITISANAAQEATIFFTDSAGANPEIIGQINFGASGTFVYDFDTALLQNPNRIVAGLGGLLRLTTTTAASTRVSCIGHDIAEAQ